MRFTRRSVRSTGREFHAAFGRSQAVRKFLGVLRKSEKQGCERMQAIMAGCDFGAPTSESESKIWRTSQQFVCEAGSEFRKHIHYHVEPRLAFSKRGQSLQFDH